MPERRTAFHLVLLLLGVVAGSTSVIFIKASSVPPMFLSGMRLFLSSIMLAPLFFMEKARLHVRFDRTMLVKPLIPGLILGLHFIFWIAGVRLIPAANASLIVDMQPVIMPFSIFFLTRERITLREIIATLVALVGVAILIVPDLLNGFGNLSGNILCFLSMAVGTVYFAFAKRNRGSFPSVWLYVPQLYLAGGLFCIGLSFLFETPLQQYSLPDIASMFGLALIPTILGHSAINSAMRHVRGQTVSLIIISDFIYATVFAFFFFGEIPTVFFYLASVFIVAGAVLAILGKRQETDRGGLREEKQNL